MQIETARLILKPISENDWELFEELHQSNEVIKYVSEPFSDSEIKERFTARLGQWNKTSNRWLTLTITEKATGNKVGVTGFYPEWEPYQQAELGFLLSPKSQGKGFGRESTLAVIDYAFNQCNFHKLIATVTEGNTPCFKLLKKLGFIHEGTLRDNFKLLGNWCNDLKLGLLKHEYESS
jgi:RimJ/RimL family protein N-acetyltransferase